MTRLIFARVVLTGFWGAFFTATAVNADVVSSGLQGFFMVIIFSICRERSQVFCWLQVAIRLFHSRGLKLVWLVAFPALPALGPMAGAC
jgi:hypothetical protein